MTASRAGKFQYPWKDGHRVQLHVDGDEIFSAMLEAIEAARSRIFLEIYLVSSGVLMTRFIEALEAAARRHVAIHLLFDDFGARGLNSHDRHRLHSAGIRCAYYNPLRYGELRRNLLRDHRKLLLVDGRLAFVGGFGITDEFNKTPARSTDYWHDVAVRVEGANVADWEEVFAHNWKYWSKDELAMPVLPGMRQPLGEARGRVVCGRYLGASDIQRGFLKRVPHARQRVWWMTAYFVPSLRLRHVLRGAARRGVDVRMLVPGPITDHPAVRFAGRRFYASLLSAGVRIFEYQPRFLHGKIVMCDDWVSLGSSNLDRWNLRWNLEGNQEVDDAAFARSVQELFEEDFRESSECQFANWQRRSWYYRGLEWFWGQMDSLQEWLSKVLRR